MLMYVRLFLDWTLDSTQILLSCNWWKYPKAITTTLVLTVLTTTFVPLGSCPTRYIILVSASFTMQLLQISPFYLLEIYRNNRYHHCWQVSQVITGITSLNPRFWGNCCSPNNRLKMWQELPWIDLLWVLEASLMDVFVHVQWSDKPYLASLISCFFQHPL